MSAVENGSKHSSGKLYMASRRLGADAVIDMLSDVDSDLESDDEIGEPICPGSDDEFPTPDSDEFPGPESDRYYCNDPCITITIYYYKNESIGRGVLDKEPIAIGSLSCVYESVHVHACNIVII